MSVAKSPAYLVRLIFPSRLQNSKHFFSSSFSVGTFEHSSSDPHIGLVFPADPTDPTYLFLVFIHSALHPNLISYSQTSVNLPVRPVFLNVKAARFHLYFLCVRLILLTFYRQDKCTGKWQISVRRSVHSVYFQ